MKGNKTIYFYLLLIFLVVGGTLFYYYFDPKSESFLLKCPFKFFTGYDCPGCGSQRALHHLLHGEIRQAFSFNPLFIIAIPYVIVGILFEWFNMKYKYPRIRKFLFGTTAIYIISVIVILFAILRNI